MYINKSTIYFSNGKQFCEKTLQYGKTKTSLKIPKGLSESVTEQTTQWSKEKVQKDKQLHVSTKHTHKTKDRVTRTP